MDKIGNGELYEEPMEEEHTPIERDFETQV
jgi:hypothetical protein